MVRLSDSAKAMLKHRCAVAEWVEWVEWAEWATTKPPTFTLNIKRRANFARLFFALK